MYLTAEDCGWHLLYFLGTDPSQATLRDVKRATSEAYLELANAFTWTYLYMPGSILTNVPYLADGVGSWLTYVQATRIATLAGAAPPLPTWPSWCLDGCIVMGNPNLGATSASLVYRIERVIDSQNVVLDAANNPGADIPNPQAFSLYCDTYPMPADFSAQHCTFISNLWGNLQFVHPGEWVRVSQAGTYVGGPPHWYSFTSSKNYPGKIVLRLAPLPNLAYNLQYLYKRRPRALARYSQTQGTVTVDATGRVLTASLPATFSPSDVGCSLRTSAPGATSLPTATWGANPAYSEGLIQTVQSDTQVTLDTPYPIPSTSGISYDLSDRIDIEQGAMETAFLRLCEARLATIRNLKDRDNPRAEYQRALEVAKCADSRNLTGRAPSDYLGAPSWPSPFPWHTVRW